VVDVNEYREIAATLNDKQKQKKLYKKCLKLEGHGDKYRYYFFFVPSTDTWTDIAEQNKLFYTNEFGNRINDVTHFLTVSTKGMPTGFEIPSPVTGKAGYWNNLFALVEYDNIRFDIGRKYIHKRILNPILELIKRNFLDLSYIKENVGNDNSPDPTPSGTATASQKLQELEAVKGSVPDLNFSKINFLKFPDNQEAGVSAIFHELLGARILKGYYGLKEGYKQNYDFWGVYKINKSELGRNVQNDNRINQNIDHPIIVEYKYEAASIIQDIDEYIKNAKDIDLLVCWDVNIDDFKKQGIDVDVLVDDDVYYFGSNYQLNMFQKSIPVIALKKFIEDNKRRD
jgi:hypothetical protein